jgi:hypothetical protein
MQLHDVTTENFFPKKNLRSCSLGTIVMHNHLRHPSTNPPATQFSPKDSRFGTSIAAALCRKELVEWKVNLG